jgi:hypothetical protein
MLHNLLRSTAVLSVILATNAVGIGPANQTRADEPRRLFAGRAARGEVIEAQPVQYGQPGLFHNYYVPAGSGRFATQLYVAPLPVPTNVGHTYYTYQPLLPHELLYDHHRSYHRYSNGGRGFNRTSVKWYSPRMTGVLDFMRQKLTRAH